MRFTKMHGTGNDYIYVSLLHESVPDPSALARRMSRPHFGCGSDGLVLIGPSDAADFSMRIYNSDGSEAGMCGNACRCVGKYVYERELTRKTELTLDTGSRIVHLRLKPQDGRVSRVSVDMGVPELRPEKIPVLLPGPLVADRPLYLGSSSYRVTCLSMGNPHCVLFVDDPDRIDVMALGSALERHPVFPERVNIEFVHASADRKTLRMRVWERGSGETLSCGSGACAALVAAVLTGRAERTCTLQVPGGELEICWDENTRHVIQEGPAAFVYDGEWLEED